MSPRRVVIVTGGHLCHNPRVMKEASCLAEAGLEVHVLGGSLDAILARRDRELARGARFRFTPVVRIREEDASWAPGSAALRAQRWAGAQLSRHLRLQHPAALGYGHRVLLRHALECDADLYIAHSEPALWTVTRLAQAGRRVGVDMEDWFSRDLLPHARKYRPLHLLERLERESLRAAAHATCPSRAMSEALSRTYGIAPPMTVYNAFAWRERDRIDHLRRDRPLRSGPSVHWFSQTIGPGRGLEQLFAALPLMSERPEIHLRGELSSRHARWLQEVVPQEARARLTIHARVGNEELLSRIAEHDIGVALEPVQPANKDLTVSNKLFQYLQAGLAVVATSTRGQSEVAAESSGIALCEPGDAASLARRLDAWLLDREALERAKQSNLAAARERFCWESVAPALVASVERALGRPAAG